MMSDTPGSILGGCDCKSLCVPGSKGPSHARLPSGFEGLPGLGRQAANDQE